MKKFHISTFCNLLFIFLVTSIHCEKPQNDSSSTSNNAEIFQSRSKEMPRQLSSPESCARTCQEGEKPKTCYYHFTVEQYATLTKACQFCISNSTTRLIDDCQCVMADGYEMSGVLTVNRMYPGPAIVVCKNDYVVVDVENRISGAGITVHWHGVWMNGYQYYDGVPHVTQCPITEGTTFKYQFRAMNPGTHFWHAHSGIHAVEGLVGSFIVKEPKSEELNSELWDQDRIDNIIFVTDWYHESPAPMYSGAAVVDKTPEPDNLLINGMGQWTGPITGDTTTSSLAIFRVVAGQRHRFRIINGGDYSCHFKLTIQNHNVTVIASDGSPIKPVNVTSVNTLAGERFDFVLNADKAPDSYWIQLGSAGPGCSHLQQLAILRYESATSDLPKLPRPSREDELYSGIILNPSNAQCNSGNHTPDFVCITDLESAQPVPKEIQNTEPDVRLYLSMDLYRYKLDVFKPDTYKDFITRDQKQYVAAVNKIINVYPSTVFISQRQGIPDDTICSADNLPVNCKRPQPCACSHVEKIALNSAVEIVLVDESPVHYQLHPLHLHGYMFYVISEGSPADYNTTRFNMDKFKKLDNEGKIKRNLINPAPKDTVPMPYQGFSVIRFIANNPGYWLIHCHFKVHLMMGMSLVLQVGEASDLPPIPKGFPKCGNFVPSVHDSYK